MDACESLALPALMPPVVEDNGAIGGSQIQAVRAAGDGDQLEICQHYLVPEQNTVMTACVGVSHHDFDIGVVLEGLDTRFLPGRLHLSPEIDKSEAVQKHQPPQER